MKYYLFTTRKCKDEGVCVNWAPTLQARFGDDLIEVIDSVATKPTRTDHLVQAFLALAQMPRDYDGPVVVEFEGGLPESLRVRRMGVPCEACGGSGQVYSCDYCEHYGICATSDPGGYDDPDDFPCAGLEDCPDCDGGIAWREE